MTWFRIDDDRNDHPKMERLESFCGSDGMLFYAARGVWECMGADCVKRETDGRFTHARLLKLTSSLRQKHRGRIVQLVIDCGMWAVDGDGLCFAEWNQLTAEEQRLRRAASVDTQRRARDGTNATVFRRDHHRCVYCGNEDDLVVDHVVPFKRGGTSDLINLVTACRGCNSSKSTKTPAEWRAR